MKSEKLRGGEKKGRRRRDPVKKGIPGKQVAYIDREVEAAHSLGHGGVGVRLVVRNLFIVELFRHLKIGRSEGKGSQD
jgi:hypothetical protein